MRLRYQRGCLRRTKRKSGPDCWEFLWREDDRIGKRVRRTAVIGTVQQYPNDVLARAAVNGLRIYINQDRNRRESSGFWLRTWLITTYKPNLPRKIAGTLTPRGSFTANFSRDGYDRIGPIPISGRSEL